MTSQGALAAGPSYRANSDTDCNANAYENSFEVSPDINKKYVKHSISGSNYFNAKNKTFRGAISSNPMKYQNYPVKISSKLPRRFLFKEGVLKKPAEGAEYEERYNFSFSSRDKVDKLHIRVDFDIADTNRFLYMRVMGPGLQAPLFVNTQASGNLPFEETVINDPTPGKWYVSVRMKHGASSDAKYQLVVDDMVNFKTTSKYESMNGTLNAPSSSRDSVKHFQVYVPDILGSNADNVNFHVNFSRVDPDNLFYLKITDPVGNSEIIDRSTSAVEKKSYLNPIEGNWTVRVAQESESEKSVDFSLSVDDNNAEHVSGCWDGSNNRIEGKWDENDDSNYVDKHGVATGVTWLDPYHSAAGFVLDTENFRVEDLYILDHGDGIQVNGGGNSLVGVRMKDIHDDCIENDYLQNLVLKDSLLDGCYVAFSARTYDDDKAVNSMSMYDGSANLFVLHNNMVRMEVQPSHAVHDPNRPPGDGHGQIFKWNYGREFNANKALKISMKNNVFYVKDGNRHEPWTNGKGLIAEAEDSIVECSNNEIIWGGSGTFPDQAVVDRLNNNRELGPDCIVVTKDSSKWYAKKEQWLDR